ncbi:MAG TPA: hypothetical protein VLT37_05470, partial [Acidocella sp.]|nr:hypothetical protein [Acidocella sp.]
MEAALLAVVALIFGLGLGWLLGGRPVAEWRQRFLARDGEARELDEKFRRAIAELAGASERANHVDALTGELAEVRAERDRIGTELATLKANAAHFDEQKRLLLEAQDVLRKEFEAAGAKVLEGAQAAFLQRAQERFAVSEEKNAERIKALLAPVGDRLKSYEEQVSALEAKRV